MFLQAELILVRSINFIVFFFLGSNRDPGVPNQHPFKEAIINEAIAAKRAAILKKKSKPVSGNNEKTKLDK